MTKRSAPDDRVSSAKRTRSSTTQNKTSQAASRRRKALPIAPSLGSSKSSDTPSSAGIRRRMNPESLAGRLGPELVEELEALLKQGMTEMPSFAVRQEIQQRYNIDRRHIYDWFHNKGLRVTTSEKREERRASKVNDNVHVPTTRTMGKNLAMVTADAISPGSPVAQVDSSGSDSSTPILPARSISGFTGNHLPYEAACTLQHQLNMGPAASQPLDYADMLFAPTDPLEPAMNSAFGQLPATSDRDPAADGMDANGKAYVDRTSHWIAEQQKIPYSPLVGALSPVPDSEKIGRDTLDAILPLDNEKVLFQHQREAYYRTISDVLPPARGIEECVGTYKEYMSRQGQKYYDRLLYGSSSNSTRRNSAYSPTPSFVSAVLPSVPASASSSFTGQRASPNAQAFRSNEDFAKWLLHGIHSVTPSAAPSPSQTPSLSETATTRSSSAIWSHHGGNGHARELSTASCIDIAEILESPVLRSRNPTRLEASQTHAVPRYGPGVENIFPSCGADPFVAPSSFPYAPSIVGYAYDSLHQLPSALPVVFNTTRTNSKPRPGIQRFPRDDNETEGSKGKGKSRELPTETD